MGYPIFVSKELRITTSGVYLIRFACGYFYIGCSEFLPNRIRTHIYFIRSAGKVKTGCKSLQQVSDFNGGAAFFLLEKVTSPENKYSLREKLLNAERRHKIPYTGSPYLLNRIERIS